MKTIQGVFCSYKGFDGFCGLFIPESAYGIFPKDTRCKKHLGKAEPKKNFGIKTRGNSKWQKESGLFLSTKEN